MNSRRFLAESSEEERVKLTPNHPYRFGRGGVNCGMTQGERAPPPPLVRVTHAGMGLRVHCELILG